MTNARKLADIAVTIPAAEARGGVKVSKRID
jgi:hypothetical protein